MKHWKTRILPFVLVAALSGCYLPGSFDAEIELSRNGFYKMDFNGYIVDLTLYNQLRTGELQPSEKATQDKIDSVINDFKRDRATKEASYFGRGAFRVHWTKSGDLIRSKFVTFFRRNQNMLSLTYSEEKFTLTVRSRHIKKQDLDRLEQMGVGMQGVLRIKTDARIIEHNATQVTDQGLIKIYGWRINSLRDPAVKLVAALR